MENKAEDITIEIEKKVIGCMYREPKLMEELFIGHECFHEPYNKTVFILTLGYYRENKNIDPLLIYQKNSSMLGTDFFTYIAEVSDIPTATIFGEYQEKLFEIYKNRLLMKSVIAFQNEQCTQEQLYEEMGRILNLTSNQTSEVYTAEKVLKLITQTDKQIDIRFKRLNNTIKLSEHDLMVIGARTGVGKTGFALNLLEDISKQYKCLYFNMEMSEQQIWRRLTSICSGKVPIANLTNPVTDYQQSLIYETIENLAKRNLKIYTGVQTVNHIKQEVIRETKNEHAVVFIDYVGLIAGYNKDSQYERVTKIVKELRQISMNLNCTIICLAQINRAGDEEPKLKDLKDSGELEQSAVSVILLHNPEQNNPARTLNQSTENLNLFVVKNRNGSTGKEMVEYNKATQRFEEKITF